MKNKTLKMGDTFYTQAGYGGRSNFIYKCTVKDIHQIMKKDGTIDTSYGIWREVYDSPEQIRAEWIQEQKDRIKKCEEEIEIIKNKKFEIKDESEYRGSI